LCALKKTPSPSARGAAGRPQPSIFAYLFLWGKFRRTKAAIKLHTKMNLRGNIPEFIHISDGKLNDVFGSEDILMK